MPTEKHDSRLVDEARGAASVPRRTPYPGLTDFSAGALTAFSRGFLPDWLGIEDLAVEPRTRPWARAGAA